MSRAASFDQSRNTMRHMALIARMETEAPEIDGAVYLSETEAEPGTFMKVTCTDAREYDLMGEGKRSGRRARQ